MWCYFLVRAISRRMKTWCQSGPRYTQTVNMSLPWSSCTFCSAISSSGGVFFTWEVSIDRQYLQWSVKDSIIRMMNKLKKNYYAPLLFKRCQLRTAHVLVRVYVLHGCSHSIADEVYFFLIRIAGEWNSASNWWRIHGLCNIFFPKNKCVLKGHKPNTCPSYQTTNTYVGVLMR